MRKEQMVMVVVVVMAAAITGGVVIEEASEAAAKAAEEGLGNMARQAIHKADKILNGSSNCKICPFTDFPYLVLVSLLAYFASACY